LFTYYVAKNLKIKYAEFAFIFIFFAPLFFKLIFSGLTEYLFALFLITAIYFALKEKYFLSVIIISFLPFVRSEGLLCMGVFIVYLLALKKYRFIPYLLIGHIIYSVIG